MTQRSGRPRLLQLITLSDWGGAQACVFALARGLRATFDVTVGCAPGGPLVDRLRDEGIPVVAIPTLRRAPAPLADLRTVWRLVRWMMRERFAVVHCHSTKAGLLGRLAARLAGVPGVVFTAHGWPFTEGYHPVMRAAVVSAERAAARLTAAIICVADHVRRDADQMRIGRPAQMHVIHNGIDPEVWVRPRQAPPGQPAAVCTVVTVSRLQEPKDPATLVEAWASAGGAHRLEIIGDGPQRPAIEALVRRLGLSDHITLTGARSDIPGRLRAADAFVLSTRWEGFPFVIIEAMMSGLPVVASNVGGVSELVVDGSTGLLVPPRDPHALAGALSRVLNDAALRDAMGAAGRRRALERFTETQMLARTRDVYAEILRRRGLMEIPE